MAQDVRCWCAMRVELARELDRVRASLRASSRRSRRSQIGQFLTPAAIAEFMGSLFEQDVEEARILDPGAGAGVLSAATVEALISRHRGLRSIEVVAYENDEKVTPYLKDTMAQCELACSNAGVAFRAEVRGENFVAAAVAGIGEQLFGGQEAGFTHAILNPPYKKINGVSETRRLLDAVGMEVSNLYAAFVWLATRMLSPGGEIVAITPRSFCNGPYFRRFRVAFLGSMALRRIHVFESRKKAFAEDDVLQENIIFHATRGRRTPKQIAVSTAEGLGFGEASVRHVPYEHVVLPGDREAFLHFVLNDADDRVMARMASFTTSLGDLGLQVSTGRVVDFRAREQLRAEPEKGTAPLVYPCHFRNGFVRWPSGSTKKPNAIVSSQLTRGLLIAAGHYVLTKRFTTKEEPRRVVAAVYDPHRVEAPLVGLENHLNYFHASGEGLPPDLAKGLALYLNSSLLDRYFRLFSGHTQVNATDLRKMRYPSREQLMRLGRRVRRDMPDQEGVDSVFEEECGADG